MITPVPGRSIQAVLGIVPAALVVIFAGVIALLALFLDPGRRQYAHDLVGQFVDLAAVIIGSPRRPALVKPETAAPANALPRRLPRSRTASAVERQIGAAPSE
jgi:hypothetical protein